MTAIQVYDTTLRDGCQAEDITFTLEDKLRIAERLDAFGIHYIEGGWPGSNPRDAAFFAAARTLKLRHAKIAAFGSTRRHGVTCDADQNVRTLLAAETPVVTIVGRTWDVPVRARSARAARGQPRDHRRHRRVPPQARRRGDLRRRALLRRLPLESRVRARSASRRPPRRAPRCSASATPAAAACRASSRRRPARPAPPSPHRSASTATTTRELAVANSLAAIEAGAVQVQGVINGFGERCGNANLCSIVANLQLKLGYDVRPRRSRSRRLQTLSHFVDELANREPDKRQAYVGLSALRAQGRAARRRGPASSRHLRAHRPGARRQPPARAALRPLRPQQHRLQGEGVRHRPRQPRPGGPASPRPT